MIRDVNGNELGERQEDAIAMAFGLKPDPAKLTADLQAAERQAAAHRASERQARIELAVLRAAGECGADPEALLDSRSFLAAAGRLDPDAGDFGDQVKTTIRDAAAATPAYRSPAPEKAQAEQAPRTVSQQWTLEQVKGAKAADVVAALEAGLLRDLGYGPRKQRR